MPYRSTGGGSLTEPPQSVWRLPCVREDERSPRERLRRRTQQDAVVDGGVVLGQIAHGGNQSCGSADTARRVITRHCPAIVHDVWFCQAHDHSAIARERRLVEIRGERC